MLLILNGLSNKGTPSKGLLVSAHSKGFRKATERRRWVRVYPSKAIHEIIKKVTGKWRAEWLSQPQMARIVRPCILAALAGASSFTTLATEDAPPAKAFCVREQPLARGPRITPFLQYQAEQAWREDEERVRAWEAIRDEKELRKT